MTPDQRADRLAAAQHSVITRRQAMESGLTSRQIERRVTSGRWIGMATGVYRVAAAGRSWQQQAMAACLSLGPRAVASHTTAAALHGLARPPPRPHVTVQRGSRTTSRLAIVHTSLLTARDRLLVASVPCTGAARTIIDCAALLDRPRLTDVVDTALCERLSHIRDLEGAIERLGPTSGRHGLRQLRAVLEAWSPLIAPGSPAEVRLLRQLAQWGLPPPETQLELVDDVGRTIGRIDVGWRAPRLGLEYDSDRFHNPRHWSRDEARQQAYSSIGWEVHRVDTYDLRPGQSWLRDLLRRRLVRPAA